MMEWYSYHGSMIDETIITFHIKSNQILLCTSANPETRFSRKFQCRRTIDVFIYTRNIRRPRTSMLMAEETPVQGV